MLRAPAPVPEGGSVLELGCGSGRILRPLAGLGHQVLGLDDSEAMLSHIPNLPTVCCRIEELRIDRTFDAVVLASTLINEEPPTRGKFLAACRRHLGSGDVAVFQQQAPSWFGTISQAPRVREDPGGIRRVIRSARSARWEPRRLFIEVEYQVGDRVWTHSWGAWEISERELADDLGSAGLRSGWSCPLSCVAALWDTRDHER